MRKAMFLTMLVAAAMLLATPGTNARFYIDIPGTSIPAGAPYTIDIKMNNNTGEEVTGISTGFRIYSPTGATWQTPTYNLAGGLDSYFDLVLSLNGFSVDGFGVDTIGLAGVSMMPPNVPNGYDDIILTIITQMAPSSDGDTLCIDSCFFPPAGTWLWTTPSGGAIPSWEGPYCWEVVAPDTCYADGDVNGDDICLSVADAVEMTRLFVDCADPLVPLYQIDLNADCVVDTLDLILMIQFITTQDTTVFDPYGGYPVLTCCDPLLEPIPDTVNIIGLEHRSEGMACLEVVDDTLHVTRLGSSGEDGITIDLEDSYTGWYQEIAYPHPDDAIPVGASYTAMFTGVEDGVPDQHLFTVRETKTGPLEWDVHVSSAASTYTINVYRHGSLVYTQSGFSFDSKWSIKIEFDFDIWKLSVDGWVSYDSDSGFDGSVTIDAADKGIVNIGGGPGDLEFDEIEFIAEDYNPNFTALSQMTFLTQDIPSIEYLIESATLNYNDIPVSNLGNAVLSTSDDNLIVSNIGSSGEDGVSIDLGESQRFDAEWEDLDPDTTLPVGAYSTFTATGQIGGIPNQTIGVGRVEKIDSLWEISADFSSIGSSSQTVNILSGGEIVISVPGHSGPACKAFRSHFDFHWGDIEDPFGGIQCGPTWDGEPIPILISYSKGDTIVMGDAVQIIPDDVTPNVDFFSTVELRAANIPSFTFTNISTGSCCVGMRGNINNDALDACNIADLTYLVAYLFGGGPAPVCIEEANVNGDPAEAINIADLTYLVAYLFGGGPAPYDCGVYSSAPPAKLSREMKLGTICEDGVTTVSIESPVDFRGLQIELVGNSSANPVSLIKGGLEMVYHYDNNNLTLGLLDMNGSEVITSGSHPLFAIEGEFIIESALISDMDHHEVVPVIRAERNVTMPDVFALSQNYPNPFNPTTTICFSLGEQSDYQLTLYNVTGQVVRTFEGRGDAGDQSVVWDASRNSSGVYFYKLEAGDFSATKKMVLLK